LQRQREGGLYRSPNAVNSTSAFGGMADHARTCRWLNPVAIDPEPVIKNRP
jgi:hypothetical protein